MSKLSELTQQVFEIVNSDTFKALSDLRAERARQKIVEFFDWRSHTREMKQEEDPHYVDKARHLFYSLHDAVYRYELAEYLDSLLNLLEERFPHEVFQARACEHLLHFSHAAGASSFLLKGDVQSGKTSIMIILALCYLSQNRDVVVLLRNRCDDKIQFIDRFRAFGEYLESRGLWSRNFALADKNLAPAHAGMFVEIYSDKHVQELESIVRGRGAGAETVLLVDEADVRDDAKDESFRSLCGAVGTKLFVTATVQDILVSDWRIYGRNIISLSPRGNYKGVNELQIAVVESLATSEDLFYAVCDVAVDKVGGRAPMHPKIALLCVERKVCFIDALFEQFRQNCFQLGDGVEARLPVEMGDVCAIAYTGKGIRVAHSSLGAADFAPLAAVRRAAGFVHLRPGVAIKEVLLWLAQNGGRARFPNIVIVTGDLANRGINFACYGATPAEEWHVTHQILDKPGASSAASVLQACRIMGCFNDDIPLKLYTTRECADKIRMSYALTGEILECITNDRHPLHKPAYLEEYTRESCKTIPIYKKAKPARFLAHKPARALNLVLGGGIGFDGAPAPIKERRGTKKAALLASLRRGATYSTEEVMGFIARAGYLHPREFFTNITAEKRTNYGERLLKPAGVNRWQRL